VSTTLAIDASSSTGRSPFVAWGAAFVLGLALTGAGAVGSIQLSVLIGAVLFLFLAVASDMGSHRLPNLLTLPALLGALLISFSSGLGGASGPLEAASGAALGFALLVVPYAIGGIGGGDVKALMALGAWVGPEALLAAVAWACVAAAAFGLGLLALRGELGDLVRRWKQTLFAALILRRLVYEPPRRGSAAASGLPFAVVLTIGLACQWSGGPPW
jgi:prepilin peptidase CpaA